MRSSGRRRSGVMWSSSPTSSPFKTPPASESRRASWGSSRRAATGNSPRWVDSLPEDSYAIHAHACAPADAARARSRGRARASRLEQLRLQQGPDPHGDHSRGGLRASPRLREARDAGQDCWPRPHAWRIAAMKGDTSTKRPKSRIDTNLLAPCLIRVDRLQAAAQRMKPYWRKRKAAESKAVAAAKEPKATKRR